MSRFNLDRVKFQGREYERAVITIDEVSKRAELTYLQKKMFSAKTLPLTNFEYDSRTVVTRYGPAVTVGAIEMVAEKMDDASAMESIIGAPRRLAREEALRQLATSETLAMEFLKARRQTMDLLKALKSDMAGAMFQLYYDTGSAPEDALRERMKTEVGALSLALEKLDTSLVELSQKAGSKVVERVYALTYLGGKMQDNLLDSGEPGIKAEGFVSELGLKESDLSPPYEDAAVNLVAAAHQATAASVL